MSNTDIQALLNGTAAVQTKIEILPQVAGESSITLTESNGIVSWDYEDFRFIKDQGFIGQFIAKQVTGTIKNPSDTFSMTDREFELQMGIKVGETVTWYSLGNFLVTKITDDEVGDTTKFEALDYTKKFNKKYEDTITYPCTMLQLVQNICEQCGCELGSTDFKHKDWVIDGNYFQNNESCRDVMKNLGKLAYSWVRVDWDNKVYLDFTKKTTVESYNKITNHEYYSLKTQKDKNIVNRVVIGYSNIDGEQTKVEDTASIEANGLCEITIFDNPLVFNQDLREKAIVGASDLLGLEYTPLEMQTIGHPWLKGYELIEAVDMEGNVHKTIPFNRTIQYFGHIKSLITIEANTKTNTEYAYESGLKNDFLNAQIQVDKKLGKITATVDEMNTKVEDITTTTQTSTGGNSLYLKEALESNALEYSVDGKCEQETSVQNANLLDLTKYKIAFPGSTSEYVSYDVLSSNSVKVTYTGSAGSWKSVAFYYLPLKAGTYTVSAKASSSDTSYDNNPALITITRCTKGTTTRLDAIDLYFSKNDCINGTRKHRDFTIDNTYDYFIAFYATTGSATGITNTYTEVMISSGTTLPTYVDFVPNSPSPDYPSEIKTIKGTDGKLKVKVMGKNAFDGIWELGDINTSTGINNTNNSRIRTKNFIPIKPETDYCLSTNLKKGRWGVFYDKSQNFISRISLDMITDTFKKFTSVANAYYIRWYILDNTSTDFEEQLEEGTSATDYEPYKEKEVLIDLAKENLFDGELESGLIGGAGENTSSTTGIRSKNYTQIDPSTSYTVSSSIDCTISLRFYDSSNKFLSSGVTTNSPNIFTTPSNASKLRIALNNNTDLTTKVKIYKGTTADDSYGLNSINDTKDKLEIVNGVVDIHKKIGKVVLDGINYKAIGKSGNINNMFNITNIDDIKNLNSNDDKISIISTHFKDDYSANELYRNENLIGIAGKINNQVAIAFGINSKITTNEKANIWLQSNPVTMYYELKTPETITLQNTDIPLYEDINHVTLVEDLETTTSIKYLRKTPISGEYALNQDLNKTNSNLADTNNQLSQAQSDISSTNTNLNNNYYNKEQVDSINSTTTQQVTQIRNTVEQNITSTNASISKIQETIENGVSKVTTTTGTFDENGLNISKSGQQMSSTLDWDGLEVVRDKGKATETEVLTVRSAGVEAENMTVRNFFIAKPIRIEKCKSITDSTKTGLGFFWIGE